MSVLISGKEALIALANGGEVEAYVEYEVNLHEWQNARELTVCDILDNGFDLRLKPRTITINGIEVPAPFEPMHSEKYFYLNLQRECLYAAKEFNGNHSDNSAIQIGAWRTEDEIKQVVAALRKIFVINNQ